MEPAENGQGTQAILIGLMTPLVMVVLQSSMFGVALPAIRSSFDAEADVMAWVVNGFTLCFVILMPLYGRLGDGLAKRTLLLAGIIIFLLGICLNILTPTLHLLVVGRVIQGAGASAVMPLTIAMISELFHINQRGKILGTWNSVAPATAMVAPLLAGLLIDTGGWRSIFGPALVIGLVATFVVRRNLPAVQGNAQPDFLHTFDWGGMVLLSTAATTLLFYISSRPITGVAALQDWRLLATACLLFGVFIFWEKRRPNPFVSLNIFAHKPFTQSSLCAATRMFAVGSIVFLMPLYLEDVLGLDATGIGAMLIVHAGALFATMRLGGQVADHRGSRWPVVLGLSVQAGAMVYFALLPIAAALPLVVVGLAVHGLGAGLAQAPLDRTATGQMPQAQMGAAAGLYSMIRFGGAVLGTTLGGVLLQRSLDRGLPPIDAYSVVFWLIAAVAFLGTLVAITLRE